MLLNRDRAVEKMEEFGLDALVASRPENVTYTSDHYSQGMYLYRNLGNQNYVVLLRDTSVPPALVVRTPEVAWMVEFPPWIEEVRTFGSRKFAQLAGVELTETEQRYAEIRGNSAVNSPTRGEALLGALKDKGLSKGRIGIEAQNMNPEVKELLHTELPDAEFEDATELFRVIRMVKSLDEIERLRAVADINERAMEAVVKRIAPGVEEWELGQAFMETTAQQGGLPEFWNTTCGRRSAFSLMTDGMFIPPSSYRLQPGDLIRFDGGSTHRKYHSDTGNCAVIGEPSEQVRKTYRATEAAIEAAIEQTRPGVRPSQLYDTMIQTGERMGLSDYQHGRPAFGHGIGIDPRDYPLIEPARKAKTRFLPGTYDVPLEENMVLNLETGFQQVGFGGTQIEYTLVITATGCEKITSPHERKLHVVA